MSQINPADGSDTAARERIVALLDSHSKALGHSFRTETILLEAREEGLYLGGVFARASLDLKWVFVELLAVSDAGRRKGIGRQLMTRVEEEAIARDMKGIWLDTFSFQAPEFYRRLGYSEFGRIDGYPEGQARHFFAKRL